MDIHVNLYAYIYFCAVYYIEWKKLNSEIMGLGDICSLYIHTHISEYLEYTHFII